MTEAAGRKSYFTGEENARYGFIGNHKATGCKANASHRLCVTHITEEEFLLLNGPELGIARSGIHRRQIPCRIAPHKVIDEEGPRGSEGFRLDGVDPKLRQEIPAGLDSFIGFRTTGSYIGKHSVQIREIAGQHTAPIRDAIDGDRVLTMLIDESLCEKGSRTNLGLDAVEERCELIGFSRSRLKMEIPQ
jgi:hypothetical protein